MLSINLSGAQTTVSRGGSEGAVRAGQEHRILRVKHEIVNSMGYALLNPLSLGYQNFQDYLTLGGKR